MIISLLLGASWWLIAGPAAPSFRLQTALTGQNKAVAKTTKLGNKELWGLRTIGVVIGLTLGGFQFLGFGLAILLAVVFPLVIGRLASSEQTTQQQELAKQLPHALELLGLSLAAGCPLKTAIDQAGRHCLEPTATLLAEVSARIEIGLSAQAAWEELKDHPVWGRAATDLAQASRSGSSLAKLLAAHSEDARVLYRSNRERWARTVSVRAVLPLTLCYLPAFILVGVVPILAGVLTKFFAS